MKHYAALKNRETKLSVIGLGYVGLPIAEAFSKKVPGQELLCGFHRG